MIWLMPLSRGGKMLYNEEDVERIRETILAFKIEPGYKRHMIIFMKSGETNESKSEEAV